jgi:type III secretion protein R
MNPAVDPITFGLIIGSLTLLPIAFLCMTSMLKIAMVLAIVRNAIGVQQVPPSMALYAIAIAVTMFIMAPTFNEISNRWNNPRLDPETGLQERPTTSQPSLERVKYAAEPLRTFMVKNTTPERRGQFMEIAKLHWSKEAFSQTTDKDYPILIPAFVVSELQLAFEIGFLVYVPLIIIDLIVSNILLALGMQMVSPMVISLPLKLLLFVQLDGWAKLIQALAQTYL